MQDEGFKVSCSIHLCDMFMQGSFNKSGKILPNPLAIGSIVYSCTFLKEINRDQSFHVPEHCHSITFIDCRTWNFLFTGE